MADLTSIITTLPKPANINFNYPKDWGSEETGLYGALVDGNIAGAGKSFLAAAASTLLGNSTTAAWEAKNRQSINKRNKALFRDLPFRQVSFTWNLRPRRREQALNFMSMIDTLRIESAPKLIQDGSLWDTNHAIWELELRAGDSGLVLFKSNELAITDISVNYTPNGFWSQHKDGFPTQIELGLTLMELALAHKDKLGRHLATPSSGAPNEGLLI